MTVLDEALERELIATADLHLARHLLALEAHPPPHLDLLVALTSAQVRAGNVCLPLDGEGPLRELGVRIDPQALTGSSLVGVPGDAGATPLVCAGRRLYLARYHAWEQQVIEALERLLRGDPPTVDRARLEAGLEALFPPTPGRTDWQRVAAALAVTQRLCVISGGPGTGKTYTVGRILRLLLDQAAPGSLRIALAAPTGKAAARLSDSIRALGARDPQWPARVPEAQTLHRLIGRRQGRVRSRHGPHNPLPVDLLIVDEVSMVDLPLMARLLAALPPQARLILLGDRHQLASVEAGQVMADLCGGGGRAYRPALAADLEALTGAPLPVSTQALPAMADHVVTLTRSRRFDARKGIGRLARAVNSGDLEAVLEALRSGDEQLDTRANDRRSLHALLEEGVLPLCARIREAPSPEEALRRLDERRVLCAVREGPQGVTELNRAIERRLGVADEGPLYHGRPVMVTVNDYEQQLFNGDIGLVFRDAHGRPRVFFPTDAGHARAIPPSRLPPHETVYAMTIHKSQGSEFGEVILVLPERETPVVTRELLYTGITRARERLILCAGEGVLAQALRRRVRRVSGLRDALWGGAG